MPKLMDYSKPVAIGIIPARYNSSRFPGKPLALIHGQSMISRVYEQARKSSLLSEVYVATDDDRIFLHVKEFTPNVVLTSSKHINGTERVAEAAKIIGAQNTIIVNIQGDEPYISPTQIDKTVKVIIENPNSDISTLAIKIPPEQANDVNKVKVVFNNNHQALYFSRYPIPYSKKLSSEQYYFKHIGIYGFNINVLENVTKLKPSRLEISESLEQLRWLENGCKIFVGETDLNSWSIDTEEDITNLPDYSISL